jgi:hypothetical protein
MDEWFKTFGRLENLGGHGKPGSPTGQVFISTKAFLSAL